MKKTFLIILLALLFLLPTIAAIVLHFVPDGMIRIPTNISGTFFDSNGESYDFDNSENKLLSSFFSSLESGSSPVDILPDDIKCDSIYSANVVERGRAKHITLYMSLTGDCYFKDENGSVYKISQELSDQLLSSEFVISLYEKLQTPMLNTFSNYSVAPLSSDFKYTAKDGSCFDGTNGYIAVEPLTYYASNTSVFSFSNEPYVCNIRAFVDDILVFEGDLDSLDSADIKSTDTVRYEIDASWEKSELNGCFGNAHYDFYIKYSPAPVFSVDRTSLEAGEFLVVKAKNIVDPDDILCSFSASLDTTPRFFENGSYYYALVPMSIDLKTGTYTLTLNCAETTRSIDLHVTERNRSASSTVYSADAPHNEQMLSDMRSLLSSIGLNCSNKCYADSTFINYETDHNDNFYFKLGFGRVRDFENGPSFDMIGIEFSASLDVDIPVINDGIVCASGEDAILGKYIVVDHGFGLKSWYCNINEASISVGDEVAKGDIIAKTGNSAFYSQSGFYLITTVLDVPVSPYAIYEDNFLLPD